MDSYCLSRIMKLKVCFSVLAVVLVCLFLTSCKDDDWSEEKTRNHVNAWIYDNMDFVYYWNDKLPANPNYNQDPGNFFGSLLNTYDKEKNPEGDRFSAIMPRYVDLLNILHGVASKELGFEYLVTWMDESKTSVCLIVSYVKKNTNAEKQGLKRGDIIVSVDNTKITEENYSGLFSQNKNSYSIDVITPGTVSAKNVTFSVESNYVEDPVYYINTYQIGAKKIGYIVYNFFAPDQGDNSKKYDKALADQFTAFYNENVTDLILDLRYNGGGYVESAVYIASALVPQRSETKLFSYTEYNPDYHKEKVRRYGIGYEKIFFTDKISVSRNPYQIPRLGDKVPKLYVLVSQYTASASELIINGLSPYMDVVLVGGVTTGKNVGSETFYKTNDKHNRWGMLPIVSRSFNSRDESEYYTGFQPDIPVSEIIYPLAANPLIAFGDIENEPLLNAAIGDITGIRTYTEKVRVPNVPAKQLGSSFDKNPRMYQMIMGNADIDFYTE